jgi:hypothetical protein
MGLLFGSVFAQEYAMKRPVAIATVRNAYQRTTSAYSRKGAAGRFQILAAISG